MPKYNGRIINHNGEDFLVMYKKSTKYEHLHLFYVYKVLEETNPLLHALGKTHKYVYIGDFCLDSSAVENEGIEVHAERVIEVYQCKEYAERTVANTIAEFLNGGKE